MEKTSNRQGKESWNHWLLLIEMNTKQKWTQDSEMVKEISIPFAFL
jgi:hypothetical protein